MVIVEDHVGATTRRRPTGQGGDTMQDPDLEALARTVAMVNRDVDRPLRAVPAPAESAEEPVDAPGHTHGGGHLDLDDLSADGSTTQRARGPRQEAILAIPEMAGAAGLKPAVIASRIDYSVSNTYTLLQTLGRVGLVEQVPDSRPQRWRLTSAHRDGAELFRRIAAVVNTGEWTTCADISLAAPGDTSAAWMFGWAAMRLPDFPDPHRILLEGGRAHPADHEHQRDRPGRVCTTLLEEGVTFDEFGRADRSLRVGWDELRTRVQT